MALGNIPKASLKQARAKMIQTSAEKVNAKTLKTTAF
jgi:hypothetical protein